MRGGPTSQGLGSIIFVLREKINYIREQDYFVVDPSCSFLRLRYDNVTVWHNPNRGRTDLKSL